MARPSSGHLVIATWFLAAAAGCGGARPEAASPGAPGSSPEPAPPAGDGSDRHSPAELGRSTLAVTRSLACAIVEGGLYCWGDRDSTPRRIEGLQDLVAVSGAGERVCALDQSGRVFCRGDEEPLHRVELPGPAVQVSAGEDHACAVLADQRIWCWGQFRDGQLGNEPDREIDFEERERRPVRVVAIDDAVSVEAARGFTCAIVATGQVVCWGSSRYHRLGNRGEDGVRYVPVPAMGLPDAVQIGLGSGGGCALRRDGSVACWGGNDDAYDPAAAIASDACAPRDVLRLSPSGLCVLLRDGRVLCGFGDRGGLGRSGECADTIEIRGLAGVVELVGSAGLGCARSASGDVRCWGDPHLGQLGRGPGTAAESRAVIPGIAGADRVVIGREYACARRTDGQVLCWGAYQRCLTEHAAGRDVEPVTRVEGAAPAADLEPGYYFLYVLAQDGRVLAFPVRPSEPEPCGRFFGDAIELDALRGSVSIADAASGVLGLAADGTITFAPSPPRYDEEARRPRPSFRVARVPGAVQVIDFGGGGCARLGTGGVSCWPWDGIFPSPRRRVVPLEGIDDARSIVAGGERAVITRGDGSVASWDARAGLEVAAEIHGVERMLGCCSARLQSAEIVDWDVRCDYGEDRDSCPDTFAEAIHIEGSRDIVDIAFGEECDCAVRAGGDVVCWGSESCQLLGMDFERSLTVAEPVQGLPRPAGRAR